MRITDVTRQDRDALVEFVRQYDATFEDWTVVTLPSGRVITGIEMNSLVADADEAVSLGRDTRARFTVRGHFTLG